MSSFALTQSRSPSDDDYPMKQRGFTVWLTGLSGSGKTTIAKVLDRELRRRRLKVELLAGSEFRQNISQGLGFSRADRIANVRRICYVAKLLARNGVAVITTSISPYRQVRNECRGIIRDFIEVYVECPLELCEARDEKGLYARARSGELEDFTGISDPYEPPEKAELVCHTATETPEESAAKIIAVLEEHGYITLQKTAALEEESIKSQLRSLGAT
jgi:adenylylsulfate kinase